MLVYEYLQNGSLKDALSGILILLLTKHVSRYNIFPVILMSFTCSILYHYIYGKSLPLVYSICSIYGQSSQWVSAHE